MVLPSSSSSDTSGSQSSSRRAAEMSGCRWRGSSAGIGSELDLGFRSGHANDLLGEFEDLDLVGIAEVDRAGHGVVGRHQPEQSLDQGIDEAEGPRLAAVAIDRDRLAPGAPGR
jgi:hypothetical protein